MTNKSILDNWEDEVAKMTDNHLAAADANSIVELIEKLLQAQRERDAEIVDDYIKFAENLHA